MLKNKKNAYSYCLTDELYLSETYLKNYNNSVANFVSRNIKTRIKSFADFGAGIGTFALKLSELLSVPKSKILTIDFDKKHLIALKKRGFVAKKKLIGTYDLIFSSNVLEHIKDDNREIKNFYSHLNSEGFLILFVPAFNIIFNKIDLKAGHFRRYKKKSLSRILENNNFKIVHSEYFDSIGFFIWALIKILGVGESVATKKSFIMYDRLIFPITRFMDLILFKKFFGKNILVIAKKIN